jgi:hypothetical protein
MKPRMKPRMRRILMNGFISLALFTAAGAQQGAASPDKDSFIGRLLKNRYQLDIQDGKLAGPALPVLQDALSGTQFVLIGEDHGISEITHFAGAVCDMVGPAGFHTTAIEVGPLAADALQRWITQADGPQHLIEFEKKYPETIAFYNFREEYDLLSHCARSASGGTLHLWGLDQELMGSSGLILTRILETHPGEAASDEAKRLLKKDDEAHTAALQSGSPADTFMMTSSEAELTGLRDLLRKEGNADSQSLIDALIESRDIYLKNMTAGYESNRERALLMKRTFEREYTRATQIEGKPPKVLLKFGGDHTYKGFNPLRNNDLGNFITELADQQGTKSLHILILGAKGSQLRFAGIGRPFQPGDFNLAEDKDSDFPFLKPMFDNLASQGWTMFDLRAMRKGFRSLGPVDKEMERMIFGNDLLILIPQATPSRQLL